MMIRNTRNNSQMRFNFLPSHLVIEICSYLDNESQLSALLAFKQWTYAFASSTKLMNNFSLDLHDEFFKKYRIQDLINIPIKNIVISNYNVNSKSSFYIRTLKKYNASIVNVKFSLVFIDTPIFVKLLDAVSSTVTHLELYRVVTDDVDHSFELLKLQSLKIITSSYHDHCDHDMMKRWMTNFKNNQAIEKLHLDGDGGFCFWTTDNINSFISTLPNVKHFTLKRYGWGEVLNYNFPAKLESLSTNHLCNHSIGFLRTQMDTLLDINVNDLETNHEFMDDLLEFIYNEMNLRSLQLNDQKLIVNYERTNEPMQIDFLPRLYSDDSDDDDNDF